MQKSFDVGKRALVLVDSEERVKALDRFLWNYSPNSWLPHGVGGEEDPDEQPILLTNEDLNLNHAQT